jgi:hypothetical protein
MTLRAPRFGGLTVRRSFLLLSPALAGAATSCARPPEPPAPPLAPLSWTHLTPLPLDVAALEVVPTAPPPPPGDIGALVSPPPADAVRSMARDRLSALGGSGQAVFLVTAASLVRERGGALRCVLGCRLEISGKGAEEGPGFMEATAQRGVAGAEATRPRAADLLLRRAMEDLNVEFEFQLRRNLRRWLVSAAPPGAAVPRPVSREELPPSGTTTGPGGVAGPLPPREPPPEPEE